MAITTAHQISDVVSDILRSTVKDHLKQLFIEKIVQDIEPVLDDYARQITMRVAEMRDPYSIDGVKVNVEIRLPQESR